MQVVADGLQTVLRGVDHDRSEVHFRVVAEDLLLSRFEMDGIQLGGVAVEAVADIELLSIRRKSQGRAVVFRPPG